MNFIQRLKHRLHQRLKSAIAVLVMVFCAAAAMASAAPSIALEENYQPYGSQINNTAAGYTQRGFAGHTQDKPALVYMGGRYYNPLTARFLSIDPKEADPSDLHSLNRYAYANNNPYRYVDPDGYTPVDLAFFAVDAVRLGVAIYSGGDIGGAAMDLGLSAIGVMSPVPGAGQALKALKVADKVVEGAKAADNVASIGRGAERVGAIRGSGDVIQVTKSGVALPPGAKHQIPENFVQNPHRSGSYGEVVEGKFKERLRIDPPTPQGQKGPNYSHYHLDGKGTHFSPRTGDKDPGFRP